MSIIKHCRCRPCIAALFDLQGRHSLQSSGFNVGSGWIYRSEPHSLKLFSPPGCWCRAWREAEIFLLHQSSEGAPRPNVCSPVEVPSNFCSLRGFILAATIRWNLHHPEVLTVPILHRIGEKLVIHSQHFRYHYKHLSEGSRSYIRAIIENANIKCCLCSSNHVSCAVANTTAGWWWYTNTI